MNYWKSSIQEFFVSFLSIIALFLSGRIYFFLDFMPPDFWSKTSWIEILIVFFSAMRFDISIASILLFLPVFLTLFIVPFSKKIGQSFFILCLWYIKIFLYISVILILVSHYFFYYYQDQFNIFFWEFWENWENSKLVIWSFFYELPIFKLAISFFGLTIWVFLLPKILFPMSSSLCWFFLKKSSLVIIPILILVGVRGTFDPLPLSMQRYRGQISSNNHLNMIHGNCFYELYASWENKKKSSDTSRIKLFLKQSKKDIPQWFKTVSESDDRRYFEGNDVNSYRVEYRVPALRKKILKKKPKHIVLIFMESQSSWLFSFKEENYQQNILKNLLAIKKQSLSFSRYFAAGNNSTSNFLKLNLSIPANKDFQTAFSSEIFKSFPNTLPLMMKSKGYKSKFFFGGSLNYHRLNSLVPKLGFQEMYGESSIRNASKTRFGVHDGDLYELVHQNLLNAKQPTFSFVVTITNHAPYEVPKYFKGLVNSSNAPLLLKNKIIDKDNFDKRMRALAYVDKSIGVFFEKAMKSSYFNETLFVLTADHPHSMGLKWSPEEFFKRTRIPLFFYSPALLKNPNIVNKNFGSHMDIPATILSMISEKSFKIHSWGRSLFEEPKIDLLTSHFIDCLNDVCITNDITFRNNAYVLRNKEKLDLCKEELCLKKSKQLSRITEAFWNSGLTYLFQYDVK